MNKILIVAAHELRTAIRTRAFWVQILLVPFFALLGSVVGRLTAAPQLTTVYAIVDQAGDIAAPLAEILDRPQPAMALNPGAPNAGAQPVVIRVPPMQNVDMSQAPDALTQALKPYLTGQIRVATEKGPQTLTAVIVIPAGFGTQGAATQVISARAVPAPFVQQVRGGLSQILRTRALEAQGVDPKIVARAQAVVAPLNVVNTTVQDRQRDPRAAARGQVAPLIFGVLLLGSVFASGQRLLAGVVEERSNKLVETILSSVTSDQFMAGKLVGIALLGVIVILAWTGSAIVMLRSASGGDSVFTALSQLVDARTAVIFAMYFVAAYIMYGAIFLGIGSTVDSAQDAQALMFPMMILTLLPLILANPVTTAPNATLPIVLSWIPFYTPLMMMMRLPSNPPLWQIIGPTIGMLVFIAAMLWMMSRIFRASILAAGSTMSRAHIWRVLRGKAG